MKKTHLIKAISFRARRTLDCLKEDGLWATAYKIAMVCKRNRQLRNLKATLGLTEEQRKRQESFETKTVLFSIIVPVYNVSLLYLKEMIQSLQEQTYARWELCIADGSDSEQAGEICSYCLQLQEKDARIRYRKLEKNEGISVNSNAALEIATGDYIGLLDHDDKLHPTALYEMMQVICRENADFIYSDEVVFDSATGKLVSVHYKSDFAPDTLLANNYICHFTVFRKELLEKAGTFRTAFDGSQDHDLFLRLTKEANKIYHIPKILYFWRSHPASVASDISAKPYAAIAGCNAVKEAVTANGLNAEVESVECCPTIYRIQYALAEKPLVSIVVLEKEKEDTDACVKSIGLSTYDNYEIQVVKTESDSIEEMDAAIRQVNGTYVVVLRNDVTVITPEWIEEMLMYAQRQDVGLVGAKEYYHNRTVYHAGIILKKDKWGCLKYAHRGVPKENDGYMGRLRYAQNVSAVSDTCFMLRKDLYESFAGIRKDLYDMAVAELCLRVQKKGYWVVFTPFAELVHNRKKKKDNRKSADSKSANEIFIRCLEEQGFEKDPFFGQNFV